MADGINYLIAKGIDSTPTFDYLGAVKNVLGIQASRREAEAWPEDRNWLRDYRNMAREEFEVRKQERMREIAKRRFKDSIEAFETVMNEVPLISWDQYPAAKAWFVRHGLNPSILPDAAEFERKAQERGVGPEEEFERFKRDYLPMGKRKLEEMKARSGAQKVVGGRVYDPIQNTWIEPPGGVPRKMTYQQDREGNIVGLPESVSPGEPISPEATGVMGKERETGKTELEKMLALYNDPSTPGPNRQFVLARIKKLTEATGLQVRVNKDGSVELIQGPMGAGGAGLQKTTQTQVEKELLSSTGALQRLNSIEKLYKPEYQELSTRWGAMWAAGKEKLGERLNETEKTKLGEYSEYRRRSIHNLNLYIKDITGAQLTVQEADRLILGMPNPGKGIMDGDSPTEFEAKMKGITGELRMAVARFNFIRKHGMDMENISLEQMPSIINKRGAEIEKELTGKYRGRELANEVRRRVAEEFGLVGR